LLSFTICRVAVLNRRLKQCTLNNVESTSTVQPPRNGYMCSPGNKRNGYNWLVCTAEDSVVECREWGIYILCT
jgi:hypothetical protein